MVSKNIAELTAAKCSIWTGTVSLWDAATNTHDEGGGSAHQAPISALAWGGSGAVVRLAAGDERGKVRRPAGAG